MAASEVKKKLEKKNSEEKKRNGIKLKRQKCKKL